MSVRIIVSLFCVAIALSARAALLYDFEDGSVQGWFADTTGGRDANGSISNTAERAWSGTCSLMAVVTSSTASWDFAPCADVPYTSGNAITASFWAAYAGTGTGVRLWLEWHGTNHNFLASAGGAGSYVNSTNWEQSVHISPGTNLPSVAYCRIQARIYGCPGDVAYVDCVESGDSGSTPDLAIRVEPAGGAFGSVVTNTATNIVFTINNDGTLANLLIATPLSVSGNGSFSIAVQPGTTNIAPGASTTFAVQFAPASYGPCSARITITNNSARETYALDLSGTGSIPSSNATNIVVAWDFQDTNLVADACMPFNLGRAIARETNYAGTYTYSGGAGSTYSLSSGGWQDGIGTKCWQITFDASGCALLTLSSKQKSSGTGPRDFLVQCRTDPDAEWTNVPGGSVTATNDSGAAWQGSLADLPLPSLCDNQTSVYVRWVVASTNAVNGGTIAAAGTSRMDDIVVGGVMIPEPMAAVAFLVWSAATRRRFSPARQVAPSSSS